MTATQAPVNVAPGSVVVVRDEEWVIQETEETADGLLIRVRGLGELVRDTTASFYASLDTIKPLEPSDAKVVADASPQYRTARLWLESTFRKTAVPLGDRDLTVSTQALADPLSYQQSAVRQALDPDNLRPRTLLADAAGLGKTLEIGMILAEPVRRGRGEAHPGWSRPRHVLEQMQPSRCGRGFALAVRAPRLGRHPARAVPGVLPPTATRSPTSSASIVSIDTPEVRPLPRPPGEAPLGRGGHRRVAQRDQRPRPRTTPPGPAA